MGWPSISISLSDYSHDTVRDKVNLALSAIHIRQSILGVDDDPDIRQKLRDASDTLRALLS
jgi:hypothetical protein